MSTKLITIEINARNNNKVIGITASNMFPNSLLDRIKDMNGDFFLIYDKDKTKNKVKLMNMRGTLEFDKEDVFIIYNYLD